MTVKTDKICQSEITDIYCRSSNSSFKELQNTQVPLIVTKVYEVFFHGPSAVSIPSQCRTSYWNLLEKEIFVAIPKTIEQESLRAVYAKNPLERLLAQADLALYFWEMKQEEEGRIWINALHTTLIQTIYELEQTIPDSQTLRLKLLKLASYVSEKNVYLVLTALYALQSHSYTYHTQALEHILNTQPNTTLSLLQYINSTDAKVDIVQAAVSHIPENLKSARIHFLLATFYTDKFQYVKAFEQYQAACKLDGSNAKYLKKLTHCLDEVYFDPSFTIKDISFIEKCIIKHLHRNPNSFQAYTGLAFLSLLQNKFDHFEEHLRSRKALNHRGFDGALLYLFFDKYWHQQNRNELKPIFKLFANPSSDLKSLSYKKLYTDFEQAVCCYKLCAEVTPYKDLASLHYKLYTEKLYQTRNIKAALNLFHQDERSGRKVFEYIDILQRDPTNHHERVTWFLSTLLQSQSNEYREKAFWSLLQLHLQGIDTMTLVGPFLDTNTIQCFQADQLKYSYRTASPDACLQISEILRRIDHFKAQQFLSSLKNNNSKITPTYSLLTHFKALNINQNIPILKNDPLSTQQQTTLSNFIGDFTNNPSKTFQDFLKFEQTLANPRVNGDFKIRSEQQNYCARKFLSACLQTSPQDNVYSRYCEKMSSKPHSKKNQIKINYPISHKNQYLMYASIIQVCEEISPKNSWDTILSHTYSIEDKNEIKKSFTSISQSNPELDYIIHAAAKLMTQRKCQILIADSKNVEAFVSHNDTGCLEGLFNGRHTIYIPSPYHNPQAHSVFIHEVLHWVFQELVGCQGSPALKESREEQELDKALLNDYSHRKKMDPKNLERDEKVVWDSLVTHLELSSYYFPNGLNFSDNTCMHMLRTESVVRIPECIAAGIPEKTIEEIAPNLLKVYNKHFKKLIEDFTNDTYSFE